MDGNKVRDGLGLQTLHFCIGVVIHIHVFTYLTCQGKKWKDILYVYQVLHIQVLNSANSDQI